MRERLVIGSIKSVYLKYKCTFERTFLFFILTFLWIDSDISILSRWLGIFSTVWESMVSSLIIYLWWHLSWACYCWDWVDGMVEWSVEVRRLLNVSLTRPMHIMRTTLCFLTCIRLVSSLIGNDFLVFVISINFFDEFCFQVPINQEVMESIWMVMKRKRIYIYTNQLLIHWNNPLLIHQIIIIEYLTVF